MRAVIRSSHPAMKNPLPNIVIVLADDTGYGDPPCYNAESRIPMPHVDRLAREGVRFTDAHSPSALCSPTRYALLTGRYYWRTPKKHALVMPYEPPVIEQWRPTLPRMLARAGYDTACVGKWHLGFRYPARGAEQNHTTDESEIDFTRPLEGGPCDVGFEYFFGTAGCSTSDPPYCFIENRHAVGLPTVPSTKELHKLPGFYPGLMAEDWDEERVDVHHLAKATEFIDRHHSDRPEDPFFLYLPISAPHNPWLPPDFARGVSGEGPRGDMNVLADWCLGQVYEALEERGILDDTLVVFTSDNGPMRGENGQRSAGNLRGYKNTAFEGGHRVPFVARWPGHIPAGGVSDELICLADIYATLAELVGVGLDDDSAEDSFSVLPALVAGDGDRSTAIGGHGANVRLPLRPALVSDTGGFSSDVGDFAMRVGRWKLIRLAPADDDTLAARREPVTDAIDGTLLFDLDTDPGETNNLANVHPQIALRLARLLDETRKRGARFMGVPC